MKYVDITGPIYNGMPENDPPFPNVQIRPLPQPAWVEKKVSCEIFDGMHSQTGTYLETPCHWFNDTYLLQDVPIERIADVPAYVIRLDAALFDGHASGRKSGRPKITEEMLRQGLPESAIPQDAAVIVDCGWGKYWRERFYHAACPYFSLEAMRFLIGLSPRILASDSPLWESREDPQNFFPEFYSADILMLAPTGVLSGVPQDAKTTLTALPINVEGTCCAPCRAFVRIEEAES